MDGDFMAIFGHPKMWKHLFTIVMKNKNYESLLFLQVLQRTVSF